MRLIASTLLVICVGFALMGCAEDFDQPSVSELYSDSIDTIEIEVDYLAGAEPYTGPFGEYDDLWALFEVNAGELFPTKTLVSPSTLSEMELIEGEGGGLYSTDRILDIAQNHRDRISSGSRATFYILYVDGYFEDDSGERNDVLGVSIGDTGVVAMFKPVLAGSGAAPNVAAFGEQLTLIHEFGHAVGLVNRGIPLTYEHHDVANGAHCSNPRCVMYYLNARLLSLIEFVREFIDTGNPVVFEQECLDDVEAFSD